MKFKNILKNYTGQLFIIAGSSLFIYSLFYFIQGQKEYWYRPEEDIRLITLGFSLTILGIFIIKENKNR